MRTTPNDLFIGLAYPTRRGIFEHLVYEVCMLCTANVLSTDKSIKYVPEKSVLKLNIGDEVELDQAGFARLSEAFLDQIEAKFS